MVIIKQSYKNKKAAENALAPAKKLGTEHAATVKNNPVFYTKTGQWKIISPKVSALCIACQMCVKNCPEAAIDVKEVGGKKRAVIDFDYCKGCGLCAEVCALKAIKMEK